MSPLTKWPFGSSLDPEEAVGPPSGTEVGGVSVEVSEAILRNL